MSGHSSARAKPRWRTFGTKKANHTLAHYTSYTAPFATHTETNTAEETKYGSRSNLFITPCTTEYPPYSSIVWVAYGEGWEADVAD